MLFKIASPRSAVIIAGTINSFRIWFSCYRVTRQKSECQLLMEEPSKNAVSSTDALVWHYARNAWTRASCKQLLVIVVNSDKSTAHAAPGEYIYSGCLSWRQSKLIFQGTNPPTPCFDWSEARVYLIKTFHVNPRFLTTDVAINKRIIWQIVTEVLWLSCFLPCFL